MCKLVFICLVAAMYICITMCCTVSTYESVRRRGELVQIRTSDTKCCPVAFMGVIFVDVDCLCFIYFI